MVVGVGSAEFGGDFKGEIGECDLVPSSGEDGVRWTESASSPSSATTRQQTALFPPEGPSSIAAEEPASVCISQIQYEKPSLKRNETKP